MLYYIVFVVVVTAIMIVFVVSRSKNESTDKGESKKGKKFLKSKRITMPSLKLQDENFIPRNKSPEIEVKKRQFFGMKKTDSTPPLKAAETIRNVRKSNMFVRTVQCTESRGLPLTHLAFNEEFLIYIADNHEKLYVYSTKEIIQGELISAEKKEESSAKAESAKKKKKQKNKIKPLYIEVYRGEFVDEYPTALAIAGNTLAVAMDCPKKQEIRLYRLTPELEVLLLVGEKMSSFFPRRRSIRNKDKFRKEITHLEILESHKMLLCCCKDSDKILFFSLANSQLVTEVKTGALNIYGIRVSPDEKFLAIASFFHHVKSFAMGYKKHKRTGNIIWEKDQNFLKKIPPIAEHKGSVFKLEFNQTSRRAVSISHNTLIVSSMKRSTQKSGSKKENTVFSIDLLKGLNVELKESENISSLQFKSGLIIFSYGKNIVCTRYKERKKEKTAEMFVLFRMKCPQVVVDIKFTSKADYFFVAYRNVEIDLFKVNKEKGKKKN